ncbi:DNA sulfur modification protein DndE [Aeromonas dhakensis]|uniref:DNA sulfur modification protein DndE n=1 Tax=Aeromonas dhakensis TaxID=196024 RepID=UPI0038D118B5
MIDNIRLSEKAKQQLIVIKRKTGIENWNVLCRWALCLSLAEESIPPFEDIQTDSSVEMTWKVFSGEFSNEIDAILKTRLYQEKDPKIDEHTLFKLHIHRGISFLLNKVHKIDSLYK